MLAHLGLRDWPFQVVPDDQSAQVWADRATVQADLEILIRRMGRSQTSSIHLLWAYFGAGKTHFLKHFAGRANEATEGRVQSYYTVFPKTVKSFLELYRTLARTWSTTNLQQAYARLESEGDPLDGELDADFLVACRALVVRPDITPTILDWLRAGRPLMADVRRAGLGQRIDSSERAIEVASSAFRLLSWANGGRSVWMIDEFQRIGELRPAQRNDANIGLHSLFNELPTSFSLFLSFSFGESKNIRYLLSEELLDRANLEQYFQLPAMTPADGVDFINGLLRAYHIDATIPEAHPFHPDAVDLLVKLLDETPRLELKPRSLMQIFNAVLEEAEHELETGRIQAISADFAESVFVDRVRDSLALDDDDE